MRERRSRAARRRPEPDAERLGPSASGDAVTSVRSASRLLDLDHLTAGVVPAVPAHAVRQLRLVALRALRVRRRARPSSLARRSRCASCFVLLLRAWPSSFLPRVVVRRWSREAPGKHRLGAATRPPRRRPDLVGRTGTRRGCGCRRSARTGPGSPGGTAARTASRARPRRGSRLEVDLPRRRSGISSASSRRRGQREQLLHVDARTARSNSARHRAHGERHGAAERAR